MSEGRMRLLLCQGLEHFERELCPAGDPVSSAQNQAGMRMPGHRFEDFTGLFRGQCGIPLE